MDAHYKRLALLGFTPSQMETLKSRFPTAELISVTRDTVHETISTADALISADRAVLDEVLTAELLRKASKLRWVHATGAGIEHYLIPELVQSSIIFTNGKILQGPGVSDHALALLLTLTRNLHLTMTGDEDVATPRPIELRDKVAVVVGCGGIGMLIVEKLAAFGMKVFAVNNENIPYLTMLQKVYMPEQLVEILPQADVVICAAPLTVKSKGTFGAREFAAMKDTAYFVNVSRGGLVQTEALLEALQNGKFRGVGLDVTDPEPLPVDHPLRSFRNVVISPHLAGMSDNNFTRRYENIMLNIDRFIHDRPLINIVDKERGY
ncbi:MAG: D-2-hydroxyacid dehydrogenase [Nanoarchaeota archaeon]